MSYHVSVYQEIHRSNYTSNVYNMLSSACTTLAINNKLPSWFNRWTDVINQSCDNTYLKALISELESNPEKYKKYNPENGWGDYDSCLKWLKEIQDNWKNGYECKIDW